jgi:hypothetical protein
LELHGCRLKFCISLARSSKFYLIDLTLSLEGLQIRSLVLQGSLLLDHGLVGLGNLLLQVRNTLQFDILLLRSPFPRFSLASRICQLVPQVEVLPFQLESTHHVTFVRLDIFAKRIVLAFHFEELLIEPVDLDLLVAHLLDLQLQPLHASSITLDLFRSLGQLKLQFLVDLIDVRQTTYLGA